MFGMEFSIVLENSVVVYEGDEWYGSVSIVVIFVWLLMCLIFDMNNMLIIS